MGCLEEDKETLTRLFDAYNYTRITGTESEVLTCKRMLYFNSKLGTDRVNVEIDESQKK
jgi:hypothetical protein